MTDRDVAGPREAAVDYDPDQDWLVVTDEEGTQEIVARDVPAWFGVRVVAAFDRPATEPSAGVTSEAAETPDEMRQRLKWPTPNHMRRTADALDTMTPARYGDILRWFADLCDATPSTSAETPTRVVGGGETRLIDTKPKIGALTETIELEIDMHNPVGPNYECDCGDQIKGETFNHHVAALVDYRLTATDGDA